MARNYICVFDCETIPDVSLLRRIYGYRGDDMSVCQQAFSAQKAASGSEFLPVMFHKTVVISAVMADEYGKFLRVNTMEGANEREILAKFIKFINEYNPRIVSFNGRGFDLPMIMVRAMKYNLSAPSYFESENRELNKNKWENYRSRYDGKFHLDLLDHISDFGSVRGLKLDTLCASLNLPGKYDVHGDQVTELFFSGEIAKINEYCESDVLNTYWLFLKYELLRGNLTSEDYASYLNVMSEFLLNERPKMSYTDVFCDAVESEILRLEGKSEYEEEFQEHFEDENFADEDLGRVEPKELDEHLAKVGLDGILQKGAVNLKNKKRENLELNEQLPEINLDDE
ncbi:3'-5' exonuclease [Campylobacter sp. RM9344]|uniref:3'-5' exonuclease n=1 Tax=Campylobacter californiensis TaxID=1032243 RepID=A0AAW3ZRK4_9BACT|nr:MULTISPECIES: 3'-5' exonuclease [unclassified Campylobacter]MBE2984200.1 3'-5' exonuclease [Campylobacter sp. RM6883]MBE2995569.1 3'-5' exonuclease [Campylobacter sp. RM6913]MBE3029762.1 3'-5' exonuclease [Campylobacter sp. RM9344]MBE3607747.1 3'-5' exonuclease [Campylobacter sp. RM9337]QCD51355.1 putative polysaccharide biosynthesis protein [Campylobacter sp. RM6914]